MEQGIERSITKGNTMHKPTFKPAQQAFTAAVLAGDLSDNPMDPHYAGHFMYMFSDAKGDHFKDIGSREYVVSS